jgi:hypothetical protein
MTPQEAVRRLNRQIDGLHGREGARVMVSMREVGGFKEVRMQITGCYMFTLGML